MEYIPTLKKKYREEIIPALMKEFGYKSVMQVPRIEKIVLNQGVGAATADKKLIEVATEEMTIIAGQKAVQTLSRKDISNFKLRKKMPIGVRVTIPP
jgi:large subunit ribosomal protein L5